MPSARHDPPKPYWRSQRRAYRGGRLEWYGAEPDEEFWGRLWQERLASDYYSAADRGDLADLDDVLMRTLDLSGRYVEAGCGLGYWVAALRARGYAVEGVESSRGLVEVVQAVRPDLPVTHGNALTLDVPDGAYDGYLSFGVVEHRQGGPEPFLTEAYRVLRPGGRMVISVPYLCPLRQARARLGGYPRRPPSDDAQFFQYAFTRTEFAVLVRSAGFHVDETIYQHPQRCLVEEVPGYFWLNRLRGSRYLRRAVTQWVPGRLAGHMVLLVATRDWDGGDV